LRDLFTLLYKEPLYALSKTQY